MAINRIVTVGYEGSDQADFLATLKTAGVDILLDIRELAISRRKGFSKTALRLGLESVGIGYRHERALGSPKEIRHRLRDDHDYRRFFADFEQHLDRQQPLLKNLSVELEGTVALLCFERDHKTCHRNVVAGALKALTGIDPIHLGVHKHAQQRSITHACANTGQGLPAA
jgi:uncharacterized protein (DUF488 family)